MPAHGDDAACTGAGVRKFLGLLCTFVHSFVRPEEPILSSRPWRLRSAARKICQMFRLIFPSLYRRGRWLSGAAPILSDPRPKGAPKASAKIRRSPRGNDLFPQRSSRLSQLSAADFGASNSVEQPSTRTEFGYVSPGRGTNSLGNSSPRFHASTFESAMVFAHRCDGTHGCPLQQTFQRFSSGATRTS